MTHELSCDDEPVPSERTRQEVDEAAKKKEDPFKTPDYYTQLIQKRDKKGLAKYQSYLKSHAARLRKLEREAAGEIVPGDYDGGYDT